MEENAKWEKGCQPLADLSHLERLEADGIHPEDRMQAAAIWGILALARALLESSF